MQIDTTAFFDGIAKLKIMIIGDVMVDNYIWGRVSRISPEAPVPIVEKKRSEDRLGGAANVALNIKSLGAAPVLCSVIGNDEAGSNFRKRLDAHEIDSSGIVISDERPTTHKQRILSGSQQLLRVDSETKDFLSPEEETALLAKVTALLPTCDGLVFQDYNKGVLSESLIAKVIKLGKRQGIPMAADPKKINFFAFKGVDLFKPNLKELKEGMNLDFEPDNLLELSEAVTVLKEKMQIDIAMITLSEKGIYVNGKLKNVHLPTQVRSVSDVSGAGDSVISVATLALALGYGIEEMAYLSNLAGGLVCEELGVVPVDRVKFEEALKKLDAGN